MPADERESSGGAKPVFQGSISPQGEARVGLNIVDNDWSTGLDCLADRPVALRGIIMSYGDLAWIGILCRKLGQEAHTAIRLGAHHPHEARTEVFHTRVRHILDQLQRV